MVIKHTEKIWEFLDHFFTYLNSTSSLNVAEIRVGSQIFFAIFTWKSAFSPFYTGNMNDFHFLPIWFLLSWRVTYYVFLYPEIFFYDPNRLGPYGLDFDGTWNVPSKAEFVAEGEIDFLIARTYYAFL